MKNLVYAGIIGVCILAAALVFMKTRGGSGGGIDDLSNSEMTWVKCLKCNQSYEISLAQYYKDLNAKAAANAGPMLVTPPLTCQKCGKDGIVKACKCEKCAEVFREGTVPNDFPDRCPKCKHSATEAKREANKAKMQGQ